MRYTYQSLAFLWLIIFGLSALTVSGVVAGSWLLLGLLIALAAPALVLKSDHDSVNSMKKPMTASASVGGAV